MKRSERMYREMMMMSGKSMGVRHRLPWRVRRVLGVVGGAVVVVTLAGIGAYTFFGFFRSSLTHRKDNKS